MKVTPAGRTTQNVRTVVRCFSASRSYGLDIGQDLPQHGILMHRHACFHWVSVGMAVAGLMTAAVAAAAEVSPAPSPAADAAIATPRAGEGAPLSFGAAVALGVVEGVTEFLPVSSTGHLILANRLLDLDREVQAREVSGALLWENPPDAESGAVGIPFTVKAAADQYAIVIQFGAILAVTVIYWRTIVTILAGMMGRNPAGLRLFRNLLVAFLPAVVIGLTLDDWIDEHLFSVRTVAAALVVGAIVMLVVSRWQRVRAARTDLVLPDPELADLTVKQALFIGLMQCGALWPGMSRSMMTLVGGYLVGLRPARSAEFTFLLGLPTLGGAAVYKAMGAGDLMIKAFGVLPLVVGGLVAAVAAAIAVRWMVGYLTRHGLALFAWYRLALAAVVLVVWQ